MIETLLSIIAFFFFFVSLKNPNSTDGNRLLELLCDVVLLVIVGIPSILLLIAGHFCSGWNEGSGAGTCSIAALTPLYNSLCGFLLAMAFGGFIFIGPVIVIAFFTSLILKMIRICTFIRHKVSERRVE